jgi:hypothetical protein
VSGVASKVIPTVTEVPDTASDGVVLWVK